MAQSSPNSNENKIFRVAIRLFDDIERKRVELALKMYNRLKGEHWQFSSANEANVVVVSLDEPGGEIFWKSNIDNRNVVTVLYGKDAPEHPWTISPSGGSLECMNVFSNIHDYIINREQTERLFSTHESFDLDHFFQQATQYEHCKTRFDEHIEWVYHRTNETVLITKPSDMSLAQVCKILSSVDLNTATFESVEESEQDTNALVVDSLVFFWELAQQLPNVMPSKCALKNAYRLNAWPPFSHIKHSIEDIKTIAVMAEHNYDLNTLAAKVHAPVDQVFRLTAACHAVGLIEPCEPTVLTLDTDSEVNAEPATQSKGFRTSIKSILSKLHLISSTETEQ